MNNPYRELVTSKPAYLKPLRSAEDARELLAELKDKISERKIVVELGCGSGGHIVEQAARNQDNFYIGFEWRFKRAFKAASKAEARGLVNLFVAQGDANLLFDMFLDRALTGIYVHFPDPWSKRRWKKHRLLAPNRISRIAQVLLPEGFLSYKTDHREYFEETIVDISASTFFDIKEQNVDLWKSGCSKEDITSEFEKLFINQGLPINYLLAKRLAT